MQRLMSMDIKGTFAYLYPRIHALVRKLRQLAGFEEEFVSFSIRWKKERFRPR